MRALCKILALIDEAAALRGEPELAVLVVRRSDGLPGQGWWIGGGGRSRGYEGPWDGPEARAFVDLVQRESFAFWKSRSGTGGAGASG